MGKLLRRLGRKPDPDVQRERALDQARSRHEELVRQAEVLADKLAEPEAELARALYVVEELHPSIRRGLELADRARAAGDESEARSYEEAAGFLADSMAATQVALEEAKILYDAALRSVDSAERAVRQSAAVLAELQGGIDEAEPSRSSEDAGRSVDVEQVRAEVEARYGRTLHEAKAARAALEQRTAGREGADGGDPSEEPSPR